MVSPQTNMNIKTMTKSDLRREIVLFLAYPFLELAILILRFLPKTWRNHLGTFIGGLSYKWNEKNAHAHISESNHRLW